MDNSCASCADCPVLGSPLYGELTSDQRAAVSCIFRPAVYRKNRILFFEGGAAQHIFALRSGLIKIVKSLENGKDRITRVVFPGELLGVEALCESTYPMTATTLVDCEICAVSRGEFVDFLNRNTDISLGMIRSLVSEVARLRKQITDMSFKDARGKIATLILSLVRSEWMRPGVPYNLRLPLSRQEIGEILELSPESVSRAFTSLKEEAVLEVRARNLVIQDMERLRAAAQRAE